MSVLLHGSQKNTKRTQVVYRIDSEIVKDFREICKAQKIKQVVIIENAMKEIIKEFKNEK